MESASFIGDDGSNNNIAIKLCQELFTISPDFFTASLFQRGNPAFGGTISSLYKREVGEGFLETLFKTLNFIFREH
jgi:hypothetical protein